MFSGNPVIVLSQNVKRESGHKVQLGNISAAKAIADVIRTCLGPRAMLKMLMDPMGGIVMTNDGNAILREIQVQHPAAKSMIEISRTQDEEVGDGTTSVIILAGEVLSIAEPFLEQKLHPTVIIQAFRMALEDIIVLCRDKLSVPIDVSNKDEVAKVIKSCLGTKLLSNYMDLAVNIALEAVQTVTVDENGRKEIDIKRYARIEKIPGGSVEDSQVIKGVVLNKDVTHSKMRREIANPRIILLDGPLEYKKGESQTQLEISKEADYTKILKEEEESVKRMCDAIIKFKPDLLLTEKGISDLAQHYLVKANITALRRLKKSDTNRLARKEDYQPFMIVTKTKVSRDEDELELTRKARVIEDSRERQLEEICLKLRLERFGCVIEEDEFPELTDEQLSTVTNAFNCRSPSQVLVEEFSIPIKLNDIKTLQGTSWLNDEVLNFYFNLIVARSSENEKLPKCYAFNTFFLKKLQTSGYSLVKRWTKKVDVFSNDLFFVPVHLGNHWCLAVVDFRVKKISYFDSMGGSNDAALKCLLQYLQDESLDKKKLKFDTFDWKTENRKDVPQQMNGSDCGMFACKFAEYLSRDAKITFAQANMPYFRQRMVYEILSKKLM